MNPSFFHFLDRCGRDVVHQAKVMLALGTDINVAAIGVLVREPRNGPQQSLPIPDARWHFRLVGGVARDTRLEESNFIDIGSHRRDLPFHCDPGSLDEVLIPVDNQCPPQVFPTLRILFGGAGTTDRMLFMIGSHVDVKPFNQHLPHAVNVTSGEVKKACRPNR